MDPFQSCGDGSTTNTGGTISYAATVVQATYTYDDAGRVKSVKNADDKYAFYDYTARGEKSHVWGQTVNPVEYIYDDFGRVYLQKTFRGGSDWDEDEWAHVTPGTADFTRWNHDEPSGLLKEKYDAANLDSSGNPISGAKKVAYTYTGAGQIYTRTWARVFAPFARSHPHLNIPSYGLGVGMRCSGMAPPNLGWRSPRRWDSRPGQ